MKIATTLLGSFTSIVVGNSVAQKENKKPRALAQGFHFVTKNILDSSGQRDHILGLQVAQKPQVLPQRLVLGRQHGRIQLQ
jgi:hypothetical protein